MLHIIFPRAHLHFSVCSQLTKKLLYYIKLKMKKNNKEKLVPNLKVLNNTQTQGVEPN